MKVILLQKIAGLGNIDDIKEVADGYARNFLFPRHLAVPTSAHSMDELEARQRRVTKASERDLRDQQDLAARVDGREIEITEKSNEQGQLYAAVGPQTAAEKLQQMGMAVDKRQIIMKPIKAVGSYKIPVKFRHGLEAEVTVTVLAKKK